MLAAVELPFVRVAEESEKRGRTLPTPPMKWVEAANAKMRAEKITKRQIADAKKLSEFKIGRALHLDAAENVPNIEVINAISEYLKIQSPVRIDEEFTAGSFAVSAAIRPGIARNIRTLREGAGFDPEGAADVAGVPVETWLAWERGDREPSVSEAELIAKTLGHEPGHLWFDTGGAPPKSTLGDYDLLWARRRKLEELPDEVRDAIRKAEDEARRRVLEELSPSFVAKKKAVQKAMKNAKPKKR